jgi:hypothetical protein
MLQKKITDKIKIMTTQNVNNRVSITNNRYFVKGTLIAEHLELFNAGI